MDTVDDFWLWKFAAPLADGSLIVCPECGEATHWREWEDGHEVACEDCGTHAALMCPRCEERFDHVGGPTFEVRAEERETAREPKETT